MHKNNINNTSDGRSGLRHRILETAMALFKKNGVRSIRMDDIANKLSISKRTLYEIYGNKEDLLLECIKYNDMLLAQDLAAYSEKAENEIDTIVYFMKSKLQSLDTINPAFFSDINKYPMIVEYLQKTHQAERNNKSANFFKQGIKHGFFMPTFNFEIISRFCDIMMEHAMETEMYRKYSLQEIFHNLILLTLRGCCTDKGIKQLDKFLTENKLQENV